MKRIENQLLIHRTPKNFIRIYLYIFFVAFLFVSGCKQKQGEVLPDPAFSKYIASFTSGEISSESPIMVQLAEIPEGIEPGSPIPQGLFRFKQIGRASCRERV